MWQNKYIKQKHQTFYTFRRGPFGQRRRARLPFWRPWTPRGNKKKHPKKLIRARFLRILFVPGPAKPDFGEPEGDFCTQGHGEKRLGRSENGCGWDQIGVVIGELGEKSVLATGLDWLCAAFSREAGKPTYFTKRRPVDGTFLRLGQDSSSLWSSWEGDG